MRALLITFLISLLLFGVIRVCVFSLYTSPANAMEATLQGGDRVVVNKCSYGWSPPFFSDVRIAQRAPRHRDILLYRQPTPDASLALGRCMALPGDTLRYNLDAYSLNGRSHRWSSSVTRGYFYSCSQRPLLLRLLYKHHLPDYGDVPVADNYLRPLTHGQYTLLSQEMEQLFVAHNVDTVIEVIIPRPHTIVRIKPANAHALYPVLQHELPGCELRGNRIYYRGEEVRVARITRPYYWVMSDNLTACTASCYLGLIPHTRLVGRATLLAYSTTRSPWWKHLFTPL